MTPARRLGLLVAAAFAIRVVLLVLRGDYIVFDEGYYLLLARSLREHQAFMLNGLPHVSLSPLQPIIVALLSLSGAPDVWISRLLGAACGAICIVPVWSLARRIGGERAAFAAALLTGLAPSLMSYLPFFPGQSWNLYFGSEPLFLLLSLAACAAAARAASEDHAASFVAAGLTAGGAFLTRAEGVVLAPLVFLLLGIRLLQLRRLGKQWPRLLLAVALAFAAALPYLLYLHGALGRWAFSGRVQAATSAAAPAPAMRATAQRGGSVLEDFVWGGDQSRFRAELYGLTPDGNHMQSQYWGVDRSPQLPPDSITEHAPPPDTTLRSSAPARNPSFAAMLWRGLGVVVPWWVLLAALIGFVVARRAVSELVWLLPLVASAIVPVIAAYVEPRSLLPLMPVAAIGAALAWSVARDRLVLQRPAAGRLAGAGLVVAALVLFFPTARAAVRAAGNDTPLQQLASAQRAVGAYLGEHLEERDALMSWHPAIAVWAKRDWRVMPEAPTGRLLRYAGRHARTVVFSRFHPSPLGNTAKPFVIVLLDGDPGRAAFADPLQLERVDETPLMFVGRLGAGR